MIINITDTFTRSLRTLDRVTQNMTKVTMGDMVTTGIDPSMHFESLRGNNFWSIRVNRDFRIIIHNEGDSLRFLYINHHEQAYRWASDYTYQHNRVTNSMQLIPIVVSDEPLISQQSHYQLPKIFDQFEDDYLLALGVPLEWLPGVKQASEESHIDHLIESLPDEVMERLLKLRDGKIVPVPQNDYNNPMDNPDTKRHFITVQVTSELGRALDYPWDEWITFLHPDQEALVSATFDGPVKISGGAGTGKTVLAVHRAVRLANANPSERVLLTTFSRALASKLNQMVTNLSDGKIPENLDIKNIHLLANEIWQEDPASPDFTPLFDNEIKEIIETAMGLRILGIDPGFVISEWNSIINYWGISDLKSYQAIQRTGRGTVLGASQREDLWQIFGPILQAFQGQPGKMTFQQLAFEAARYEVGRSPKRYRHVVVDETQDFGPAELTLVRSLVNTVRDDLFLCGDANQMIYRKHFPWNRVGIEIQGRSRTLDINYRNTKEIQIFARTVLANEALGGDGETDSNDALSPLKGERPVIIPCKDEFEEQEKLAGWIRDLIQQGYKPEEISVLFRRTRSRNGIVAPSVKSISGYDIRSLLADEEDNYETPDNILPFDNLIPAGTMHGAKGLEFKAVAVVGCGDSNIPNQTALDSSWDDTERNETLGQERNVLFVALTRARERLLVTHTGDLSSLFSKDADKYSDNYQA